MAKRTIDLGEPEWLTVDEVAKTLGVPARTFHDWIDAGRIPPPRDFNNRVYLYPRDVVEAISALLRFGWLPRPENGE